MKLAHSSGPTRPASAGTAASVAAWVRALLARPDRAAALLWVAGATAVALVLPLRHWPHPAFLCLISVAGVAGLFGVWRANSGLPHWSLQVDVAIGNLLVSLAAGAGASQQLLGLANLYFLVALFALLYFPLTSALPQIATGGLAYAGVLALGPRVPDPLVAWLAVFGTVVVLGPVVFGLVSALGLDAREDALTGLANRRAWDERLEEELERARRTGVPCSVAMIDLDGFKAVNDRDGHQAGDRLLQQLAQAWGTAIRGGGDFLARLGGDEFAVLAPGSGANGIVCLTTRLGKASPEGVSCSVGMATWDGTESAHDLLRRADQAMYEVKLRRRPGQELSDP
ncbi:MAG: GGDEF domain-containing protein [Acidimicrobiales bacterium]